MLDEVDEVSILGAVLGLLVGELLGNAERLDQRPHYCFMSLVI